MSAAEDDEIIERIAVARYRIAFPRRIKGIPDDQKPDWRIGARKELAALRAAGLVVTLAKEEVE